MVVVSGRGGFGGLEHAVGDPVEGFDVAEVGLAVGTGLVGAVGAHLDAGALVVVGDVRRSEDSADLGVSEDDGALVCGGAGSGCGEGCAGPGWVSRAPS